MTEAFIESFLFKLENQQGEELVNGQSLSADFQQVNPQLFHVIHEGKSYDIFVHKIDQDAKTVELSINGKKGQVKLVSRIERMLKQLGMENALVKKMDSLKAPMPGLIHSVSVEVGQEVLKGEPLLILEAMKMENVIKSPGDGVVKEILVQPKASVEKGELLISFA
ncbi:MAG: biotin/lipoyl-containing protein [Bacteroidota bacterium]